MTPIDKLTKKEALEEIATLSKDVEFDKEFSEKNSLAELSAAVEEGRALLGKVPPTPVSARAKPPTGKPVEDYLRQYQYRKNCKLGSPQSDPQPGSRAELIKKKLLLQPRIRMFIPKPESEKGNFPHSVTINGYRLDLPKNAYIDLPEQVADMIQYSFKQTQDAFDRAERSFGVNRQKEGIRVGDALV